LGILVTLVTGGAALCAAPVFEPQQTALTAAEPETTTAADGDKLNVTRWQDSRAELTL
jgi:hypothetical protein